MAKVVVTIAALKDIKKIVRNIVELTSFLEFTSFENSGAKFINEIYEKFDLIGLLPKGIGRMRDDGSYEAFCRRYRIVYEIFENGEIHINTVIHSSRIYPRP